MLRQIVGWRRLPEEDWRLTMSRMNTRVAFALRIFLIESWTVQLSRHQFRFAYKVANNACEWAH